MSEQKTVIPGTEESEIIEKLAAAKAEGIDLVLLERGVWKAQEDVAMQAAIQLSQGLYPQSFFRLLGPLANLSAAMAKLRGDEERSVIVLRDTAGNVVGQMRRDPDETTPPAPGDSSVT